MDGLLEFIAHERVSESEEAAAGDAAAGCIYTFKRGPRTGERCGNKPKSEEYCGKHQQQRQQQQPRKKKFAAEQAASTTSTTLPSPLALAQELPDLYRLNPISLKEFMDDLRDLISTGVDTEGSDTLSGNAAEAELAAEAVENPPEDIEEGLPVEDIDEDLPVEEDIDEMEEDDIPEEIIDEEEWVETDNEVPQEGW